MGYYDNGGFGERLGCMAAAAVLVALALVALALGARALYHWVFS